MCILVLEVQGELTNWDLKSGARKARRANRAKRLEIVFFRENESTSRTKVHFGFHGKNGREE